MNVRVKRPKVFFFTLLFLAGTALGIAEGPQHIYSSLQKAFYLAQEEQAWIRPGLNIKINNVTIPADRKPVVTFTLTDDNKQPLDREGNLTPAPVSLNFIMAYIPANAPQYVDYSTRIQSSTITGKTAVQAATDTGGKYDPLGDGTYTYTFVTTLPATYDTSATHTAGIYGTRNLEEFGLSLYMDNATYEFVPNGAQVTKIREIVPDSACNQCHDPLTAHGETGRRDVAICILCHTPQTTDPDTGNTVDMKVMTHKIHMGADLPSVQAGKPYVIIGRGGPADYSTVVFPTGDLRTCNKCHQAPARQVNNWMLNPTAATCGSCHDNVNFQTGENHAGGPQPNDTYCALCHWPQGEFEYDASVAGAHTAPWRSTQLRNPKFEIVGITNAGPGQKPTVQFKLTDKTGAAIAPSSMTRLAVMVGGPTSDYKWYARETATSATVANGIATYTFTGADSAIPSGATGTYVAEIEGYINMTLNPGTTKAFSYRDAGINVVKEFPVTGTTVTPHRTVVDIAKCNKCHEKLQLHGNNRNQVISCEICHNPTAVYPTTPGPTQETIDMRTMVHKIHTGEELEGDYAIGGTSFKEIRYPGDRRDCNACHVGTSYTLPLPSGVLPVTTPKGLWTPTLPAAASCLSCHDGIEAGAHAFLNTATISGKQYESCSVCHKEGADFAVSEVHAR